MIHILKSMSAEDWIEFATDAVALAGFCMFTLQLWLLLPIAAEILAAP